MQKSAVRISAVIITYNEARNIGRCIDSLQGVADEIVVLDSGSTDTTSSICAEKGVVFHLHPFDDYAAQKNRAVALASHDIILSLDADEALSATLRDSILAAKANWNADAFVMKRLTSYCGHWVRHGGWYPDPKLRLYDRRKGQWAGLKIHEQVEMKLGASTARIKGDLLHYSFYDIEQHMDTVNKFSTLKARLMLEKGERGGLIAMLFMPIVRFLTHYIVKSGFRDGRAGLNIAINSAHGAYLRYAKLRELRLLKENRGTPNE
jgi:glycosyltransferase involved in cell wall biosynthesis